MPSSRPIIFIWDSGTIFNEPCLSEAKRTESHSPYGSGIVPNSLWLLDSSSFKFQCALLLKLGTHYDLRIELHYARSLLVSLRLRANYPRGEAERDHCGSNTSFVEFPAACRGEFHLSLYPFRPEADDRSPPAFLHEGGKGFPLRFARLSDKHRKANIEKYGCPCIAFCGHYFL
jgi:hypothetical protein